MVRDSEQRVRNRAWQGQGHPFARATADDACPVRTIRSELKFFKVTHGNLL